METRSNFIKKILFPLLKEITKEAPFLCSLLPSFLPFLSDPARLLLCWCFRNSRQSLEVNRFCHRSGTETFVRSVCGSEAGQRTRGSTKQDWGKVRGKRKKSKFPLLFLHCGSKRAILTAAVNKDGSCCSNRTSLRNWFKEQTRTSWLVSCTWQTALLLMFSLSKINKRLRADWKLHQASVLDYKHSLWSHRYKWSK